MHLRKYYNLLGLNENATLQEVRKKYRMLAMHYHPDKNPSAEANAKFIQINEAYEIILGRKKAPVSAAKTVQRSKQNSHEERIKTAKERYKEQLRKEQIENERFYQSLIKGKKWRLIKLNAIIGTAIASLILLDIFLPRHYEKDRVEAYARDVYSGGRNTSISLVKTINGHELWIDNINYALYAAYPEIYIERSFIFHDPVNIISIQKVEYEYYPVYYTFYDARFIAMGIFLIPLFTLWYKRRTIIFTILWYLSLYLSGIIILLFLLTNDHWAHLLTFGFL
jgi:hypothetical protein